MSNFKDMIIFPFSTSNREKGAVTQLRIRQTRTGRMKNHNTLKILKILEINLLLRIYKYKKIKIKKKIGTRMKRTLTYPNRDAPSFKKKFKHA